MESLIVLILANFEVIKVLKSWHHRKLNLYCPIKSTLDCNVCALVLSDLANSDRRSVQLQ